jgi:hypothetical protein
VAGSIAVEDDLIACMVTQEEVLLMVIQSKTDNDIWMRGFHLNKGQLKELDARGEIVALKSRVCCWTSTLSFLQARNSVNGVSPSESKVHGIQLMLGTTSGDLYQILLEISPGSHTSWKQIGEGFSEPFPTHISIHDHGWLIAIMHQSGRLHLLDPAFLPVAVQITGSLISQTPLHVINLMKLLHFRCPASIISWAPSSHYATLFPHATLMIILQRGPIMVLRISTIGVTQFPDIAGYVRLLARTHAIDRLRVIAHTWPLFSQPQIQHYTYMVTTIWEYAKRRDAHCKPNVLKELVMLLNRLNEDPNNNPCGESKLKLLWQRIIVDMIWNSQFEEAIRLISTSQLQPDLLHFIAEIAKLNDPPQWQLSQGARALFVAAHPHLPPSLLPLPIAQGEYDDYGNRVGVQKSVEVLIAEYQDMIVPIAQGKKKCFGLNLKRLATFYEVRGQYEKALHWWRQMTRNDADAERAIARLQEVIAYQTQRCHVLGSQE